jgi:hypothetical protein
VYYTENSGDYGGNGDASGYGDYSEEYYDSRDTEADLSGLFDENCDVFMASTNVDKNTDDDWTAVLYVHGKPLRVELDTGAKCNIVSLKSLNELGITYELKPSNVFISGVHGQSVKARGCVLLPCVYENAMKDVLFQVLDGSKCVNLLGGKDCLEFDLVTRVHVAIAAGTCRSLVQKYSDVLGSGIGCIPGEYEIKVDESVTPVVHAPRSVPSALREDVKKELEKMEQAGILRKVTEPTPWVSSMVVVSKKDKKSVRICIDPSDLNKAIKREHFPMSSIEDIVTRLHGSKFFSTLDANMGYFQIKLTEKSSYLTTFNTPFGRYRYLRMPMGAKCSAEVFQRAMANAFEGLDGVEIVVDDILVHGSTLAIHNERLEKVLERCRQIDLKLNSGKCHIGMPEVTYVGHRLTGEGLKATPDRLKAITEMRTPQDVKELEAVLGMIAYVAKFIPNLSELTAPLREAKQREVWHWGDAEQAAYDKIKAELASDRVLKFYNVNKPLLLSVDASTKGLGAAVMQDGGVVAYASKALTPTEQRYAQIEKEMLAVVFGCTKFHKLIYGKNDVTIESDHKPLETLLRKPMSAAPMRIQRMRLKLQPYSFTLIHVSGKSIGLADCLSRLPQPAASGDVIMDEELMVCKADTLSFKWHDRLERATREDENFQTLRTIIFNGWPASKQDLPIAIHPYWDTRDQLSTYNGVVYKGERIVIPSSLREEMLKILHTSHTGMVKTKQRARDMIYWPGLNRQIEDMVSKCDVCLSKLNKQPKEPMTIHPLPSLLWNKVGTDLLELEGSHYLLLTDYYSNFIEIEPLQHDTRSSTVIKRIKAHIARYGIMETLISDNGPQYASAEFEKFTKDYGINHITSSPTYQQSNGLAEKAVQTMKDLMDKCKKSGDDMYLALLDLRNTPRDDVIGSPMQRLHGRRAQTRLPVADSLLKPAVIEPAVVHDRMMEYRRKQKLYYDRGAKPLKPIEPGVAVRVRTPGGWKPAEHVKPHDLPNSHIIKAGEQGRTYRRNRRDMMTTKEAPHVMHPPTPPIPPMTTAQQSSRPPEQANPPTTQHPPTPRRGNPPPPFMTSPQRPPMVATPQRTRPSRPKREPAWLKDYVKH